MKTEVLSIHTPELFARAVDRAAAAIGQGEAVAVPTETVYGLAANALDPGAVRRIYQIKGRPTRNPLIVHVASWDQARLCVREWPEAAQRLAEAFWPGPLTLVASKSAAVPGEAAGGGVTVGLRWPAHAFMRALILKADAPLAAPSANLANRLSPTTAAHVLDQLEGRVGLAVDGGPCQVGIESTVVDVTVSPCRVLRPGVVDLPSLREVAPAEPASEADADSGAVPRSPGQMKKHYAPRGELRVLAWESEREIAELVASLQDAGRSVHVLAHERLPREGLGARLCLLPQDPEAYARALYAELYRCDQAAADVILVEAVPDESAWQGVADRLRRAAS